MKFRDSGMPNEEMWDDFFNPNEIIDKMEINNSINTILDIGCGYGTFLIPESRIIKYIAVGIDIDGEMIKKCKEKIEKENITKINLLQGDIANQDTISKLKLISASFDYITLFNILHCEEPISLLKNTYSLLSNNGTVGVIHWKYEKTPRGPSMDIRPKPEQIIEWAKSVGFFLDKQIDLPPFHYGLIFNIRGEKR